MRSEEKGIIFAATVVRNSDGLMRNRDSSGRLPHIRIIWERFNVWILADFIKLDRSKYLRIVIMFARETMSSFWLKISALLSSAHKEGEGTAKSIKGKDLKNVNNVGNWRSFCKENHVLILISLNSYTQELYLSCPQCWNSVKVVQPFSITCNGNLITFAF